MRVLHRVGRGTGLNRPGDASAWDAMFASGTYDLTRESPLLVGLLSRAGRAGAFLDLGCGLGRNLAAFPGPGPVVGVDASARALSGARTRPGALCVRALMTRLPFRDASFGTVLAWRSLYLQDAAGIRATVAEILRVLAPGGVLVCSLRSEENLLARHARAHGLAVSPGTWVLPDPPFSGATYHFLPEPELREIFSGFILTDLRREELSHTALTRNLPGKNEFWVFTAKKP